MSSPKGIREAKHGCAGLSHQGKPNDLEIERIDFLSISSSARGDILLPD